MRTCGAAGCISVLAWRKCMSLEGRFQIDLKRCYLHPSLSAYRFYGGLVFSVICLYCLLSIAFVRCLSCWLVVFDVAGSITNYLIEGNISMYSFCFSFIYLWFPGGLWLDEYCFPFPTRLLQESPHTINYWSKTEACSVSEIMQPINYQSCHHSPPHVEGEKIPINPINIAPPCCILDGVFPPSN